MNKTDRIERIRRDIDQQISYCHTLLSKEIFSDMI